LGDIPNEKTFAAANNVSIASPITNFQFSNAIVRAFNAIVSITIVRSAGDNYYANYELKGIQKDSGTWSLNSSYVGDATGVVFTIDNSGQMTYTSTNITNWSSTTFKFKAYTTSV
jgi:hypothetical protein